MRAEVHRAAFCRTHAVFAGPEVNVVLAHDIGFEKDSYGDPETLTLTFEYPQTLLCEAICIGALFGFDVVATIVDDQNGWRERLSFEFRRVYRAEGWRYDRASVVGRANSAQSASCVGRFVAQNLPGRRPSRTRKGSNGFSAGSSDRCDVSRVRHHECVRRRRPVTRGIWETLS